MFTTIEEGKSMAKFLLGIAIIAFTTFIGYLCGKKYRKRKAFFAQYTLFNERFINEVSYYKHPLQTFFTKYAYKEEFDFLLQRFLYHVKNGVPLYGNLLSDHAFDFLKREEKVVVENYFSMLGKGDTVSQKTYFSAQKSTLEGLEKESAEHCKKVCDLFIKLGFLCGLLVLILII